MATAQVAVTGGTAITASLQADRWDEAIAKGEELLALQAKVQGPKHFETADVERGLKALRRVAPMSKEDRVAYLAAHALTEQAAALVAQGKYSQAQRLLEQVLEVRRRLLTDDHPNTAESFHNLGHNLKAQGKYADAGDRWRLAVKSQDAVRLKVAFTGLERAGILDHVRLDLAAVIARLGQPAEARRYLEENLGRRLLDELAARQVRRLTA